MYEHLHKVIEILKNKQNEDKKSRKSWYYKQYKLFYVKQGFDKYEKTIKKFFIKFLYFAQQRGE